MNEIKTLEITHPDLAKEWHPTKNGNLQPKDVTAGSNRYVWWLLPYDDPQTGKHFDFEWQSKISNRAVLGRGCPYLSGKSVYVGFNDLSTTHPHLATQWHPTKNGNLKVTDVTFGSGTLVWWLMSYDDETSGKHFDFEWQTTVNARTSKSDKCPFLTGKSVWPGFNDLSTTHPEISKEWHPAKNGKLRPEHVSCRSRKKVWWLVRYDDPVTQKHFDFEWKAAINKRTLAGRNCPYLSNQKVFLGFNDLFTTHPDIAAQWHPTKNGKLKPTDITSGSNKKVWWICHYDDVRTGKHFDFEWNAPVKHLTRGNGCPYLSGRAVYAGFNDLASTHPEIAREWHPIKNGNLKPTEVTYGSSQKVWWQVIYDGKEYEWQMSIANRTYWNAGCPLLSGSHLERAVYQTLSNLGVAFQAEKTFDDFKTTFDKFYRFDCYLDKEKLIIECDGEQHFIEVDQFGGKTGFQQTITSDNEKNLYSFANNIPILRIPYKYLRTSKKLKQVVTSFVTAKTIPQEIIDFYSQFEFSNYIQYVKEYESQYKAEL